jgi:hypothetical protein
MAISAPVNGSADASVFSRIVCQSCNIFGMYLQAEMTDRLFAIHEESGVSYEVLAETMIQKWNTYKAHRRKLTWSYPTAIGFLRWDLYDKEDEWPWIEVSRPRFEPGIYNPNKPIPEPEAIPEDIQQWRLRNGMARL